MTELLAAGDFLPHGWCFRWDKALLWLHVASDAIITLAYYSIPIVLLVFAKKRVDLQYKWMFVLFGLFILLCGTTHLMGIWNIWRPDYWLSGAVKALTALVSLVTAVLLWPLLPKALALPSPAHLQAANEELQKTLDSLRRAEGELRNLSWAVEYSSSMVLITNLNGEIEYCNPAFLDVTGYSRDEVIGQKPSLLKSGHTPEEVYSELWETLLSGKEWHGELLDRKKNGDLYWAMQFLAPVFDEQGRISHLVSVAHDISALKKSEEDIRRLAFYDPLTGLPNRALFRERLEQAMLRADREEQPFALLYLDLDRFKNINDTLGHFTGDQLLIAVGRRIKGMLREMDTVARLGGDEFAVILPDLARLEDAGMMARKIVESMGQPVKVDESELFVGASIGISFYPNDAIDMDRLVMLADSALYEAKKQGGNRFQFHADAKGGALTIARLQLETELRRAVERDELCVYYQPKMELASGRVAGVEALLRWRRNGEDLIPPGMFIAIAEETGLIVSIGEWVFRAVCRQLAAWRAAGTVWPVSVNLSARQFRDPELLQRLIAIQEETGVEAELLDMEITESAVMDNPEQSAEVLQALHDRGVSLSIDDFGTGYSSLAYLKRFPVNALKIDQSFVRDIASDANDAAIVRVVIELAHNLGLKVIAEGVETLEQQEFLQRQGCDMVQGFYYGRPVLPEELFCRFAGVPSAQQ